MENQTITETIISLESSALEAWLHGNPSPYLELYTKAGFTYFDTVHERRIDGWDKIKELYETMRGQANVDKYQIINPVVQSSDSMAVLTYNLEAYFGETLFKENCTEVYKKEGAGWKIIHSHWSMGK